MSETLRVVESVGDKEHGQCAECEIRISRTKLYEISLISRSYIERKLNSFIDIRSYERIFENKCDSPFFAFFALVISLRFTILSCKNFSLE